MSRTHAADHRAPLAAIGLVLLICVARPALAADGDGEDTAELRDRIERLEREIDKLKDARDEAALRRRERVERERRLLIRLISLESELASVIDAAAPLYPQADAARGELAAAQAAYDAAGAELAPLKRQLEALIRIVEQRRRDLTRIESELAEDQATSPAMFETRAVLAAAREDLAKAERLAAERIAADSAHRALAAERATLSKRLGDAAAADDPTFDRTAAAQRLLQLDDQMSRRAGEVADLSAEREAMREAATMLKLREDDAKATIEADPLRIGAAAQVDAAQADAAVVEPQVQRLAAQVAAADKARRSAAASLDDLTRRIAGLELRAVQLRREIAWVRGELR